MALGLAIRKLKQQWRLGEVCCGRLCCCFGTELHAASSAEGRCPAGDPPTHHPLPYLPPGGSAEGRCPAGYPPPITPSPIYLAGVILSSVLTMASARPLGVESTAAPPSGSGSRTPAALMMNQEDDPAPGHQQRLELCQSLLASAAAYGLEECWQWKPVLDGKAVMGLLGMPRPGPEMGQVVAAVMEWQLGHPGGQEAECRAHIVEKWARRQKE